VQEGNSLSIVSHCLGGGLEGCFSTLGAASRTGIEPVLNHRLCLG
jgi:hypothetical protein